MACISIDKTTLQRSIIKSCCVTCLSLAKYVDSHNLLPSNTENNKNKKYIFIVCMYYKRDEHMYK